MRKQAAAVELFLPQEEVKERLKFLPGPLCRTGAGTEAATKDLKAKQQQQLNATPTRSR